MTACDYKRVGDLSMMTKRAEAVEEEEEEQEVLASGIPECCRRRAA